MKVRKRSRRALNTPIDIVVITHNAKEKLKRCLASIRKHTRNVPYALTVVDNCCTDGTAAFLKTLGPGVRILTSTRNTGFSGGANLALRATKGKYIALVDDDAEVSPNWLKILHAKITESRRIGIVGCKIIFPNRMIFCAELGLRTGRCVAVGHGETDHGKFDGIKDVDALCGACWLMRREVVDKIGLYDERFFPCKYEDCDYCMRAKLAGFRVIYHGGVTIIHHNLNRDGEGKEKTMLLNRRRFMRKWNNLDQFIHPVQRSDCAGDSGSRNPKCYLEKAIHAARKHRYASAIKWFKLVIQSDPYNLMASYCLAMIYRKTGQWDKAKLQGARSLDIFCHPKNRLPWLDLSCRK